MGWFLTSLCHETGHCLFAWLGGAWAFPAISLAGHAMAQHGPPSTALALVIWGLIAYAAYARRDRREWLWVLGAAALVYPLFAFTSLKEVFFLLDGQALMVVGDWWKSPRRERCLEIRTLKAGHFALLKPGEINGTQGEQGSFGPNKGDRDPLPAQQEAERQAAADPGPYRGGR